MLFVQVAIAGPFLSAFDYVLPESLTVQVGVRVRVPFRNKTVVGWVVGDCQQLDYDTTKVKSLLEVLDDAPVFAPLEWQLLTWSAHYYHEPLGNVLQTALPKKIREGALQSVAGVQAWQLTPLGQESVAPVRAKVQVQLLDLLKAQAQPVSAAYLNEHMSNWRAALKRLQALGWVAEVCLNGLPEMPKSSRPGYKLNAEQQAAVDAVTSQQGFKPFLLEGVTGSGKTETYLGMIEQVIAQGKQVLVLVPEIGLTPQTVQRFEAHLQQSVALLHSGLNDSERHAAWWWIKSGAVKVLLGTRSAVFTPFENLGLCIMDEEHDVSFKQQDGFRYSARDCLIRRAQLAQVPVVLGSATPSLETLHNALMGKYTHLALTLRATGANLPSVALLDVRGAPVDEGVAPGLREKMAQHLAAGNQVLLFLNRRGFAPVLMCHDCGWQARCPSCDANMTYHSQFDDLRCHHCGHQVRAPKACPQCGSGHFVKLGQGTERLTEVVQSWFADKVCMRIDRDTTSQKGEMSRLTELARLASVDILIGTQMLAKGHHFPNVTLVGVLDVDQGLFSTDFRAAERMAQLIVQVSGRAGRADKQGEVVIQTHHPEHPLLRRLVAEGYGAFARAALGERKTANLPPFSYGFLVRAEALEGNLAWDFLQEFKIKLVLAKKLLEFEAFQSVHIEIMGPVCAPMLRRQGRYRFQLWCQSSHRKALHQLLAQVEGQMYALPLARKVRWSLDIDPQDMY